jgi:hypothetical protein
VRIYKEGAAWILIAVTPREFPRQLALADAGLAKENDEIVLRCISEQIAYPVEKLLASDEWKATARRYIALKAARR